MNAHRSKDLGSVTPLVLGMAACLLILTVGITAAGSAFLGGQRISHLCDGAVAAAADSADPHFGSGRTQFSDPIATANHYLAIRAPDITATITLGPKTVTAICRGTVAVAFGALFGRPRVERQVTARSRPLFDAKDRPTVDWATTPESHD